MRLFASLNVALDIQILQGHTDMCKIAGDSMVVPIVAMAVVGAIISSKHI